mgnify:FL=1
MLAPCRHIAVGVLSPIPGGAALLARAKHGARVMILGARDPEFASDGAGELFDLAAQGKLDAFFLSGGQIDGKANINLTGAGGYPRSKARWSGAFGSAFLYFQVPRVILFRESHELRAFPEQVDFVTAPGTSPEGVWRRGGPHALVTELCVFALHRARARLTPGRLHTGVTAEEVGTRTGCDYDAPESVPETPGPDAETLALIRGEVAESLAGIYPEFAARVFGRAAA